MLKYLAKRIGRSILTLFVIVTLVFCLLRLMPVEGYFANYEKMTEAQIQAGLQSMGLLDPLPVQIGRFWWNALHGDLGVSHIYKVNASVTGILAKKLPISIQMGVFAMLLSLVIGIVMAEVLHDLGADQVRVKWPKGLYLNDRKLAGILVELTGKTGDAAQIVIGAGLNMVMRNVQNDVVNQAWTNLQEAGITIDRNTLAVRMIKELRSSLTLFEQEGLTPFLSRWEKLDNFINRPVKLLIGEREIVGISRGINAQGALLLEQDGAIKPWVGGEISLRSAE